MAKIPGIYVAVRADLAQLREDVSQAKTIVSGAATAISNSMDGALSGSQVKSGINSLITNLDTLSRVSKTTGQDFKGLGVDLGALKSVTGITSLEFGKLQEKLLQTQAANVQEKALRQIGISAGLTQNELKTLGLQFGLTSAQISKVTGSIKEFADSGSKSTDVFGNGFISVAAKVFIVVQALETATRAVNKLFFDFNATIEVTQLGIASAFLTSGQYIDTQTGKVLAGQEAFKAAQVDAKAVVEELKAANLETIATLDQLVRAYQETLPVAMAAGFDKSQVQQFTTAMIQAAGAIDSSGALMHQLGEETRSLLTGNINPRTSRIATVLGVSNDDVKEFKGNADGMFAFLMDKLSAYKIAGVELQSTWKGLVSNTVDIFQQMTGMIGEPLFEAAKIELKALIDSIVVLDENTKKLKWSDDFLSGAKDIQSAITAMIAEITRFGMLLDKAGGTMTAIGSAFSFGDTSAKFKDWNKLYEDRYNAGDARLQGLADAQNARESGASNTAPTAAFKQNPLKVNKEDVSKAYKEAYSVIGGMTTEVYDAMKAQYEKDRDDFIRLTGDKATAQKVYLAQIASLDRKNSEIGGKNKDFNAANSKEVEYLKAVAEKEAAIKKAANALDEQNNQEAYALGLKSYQSYLEEKHSLTAKSLQADLDAKKQELVNAQSAKDNLLSTVDSKGNPNFAQDAATKADALKKVEQAAQKVIEAQSKLDKAQQEGAQESKLAIIDNANAYKQIEVQLLETQGKTVEAAQLQASLDEQSLERKRLELAAIQGIAGAQEALNAVKKTSDLDIDLAKIDSAAQSKEAAIALAEINGENQKSIELQVQLLDLEIQRAVISGKKPEEIQLLQRQREELEKMKDPLTAFAKGWQDVIKEQKTSGELMSNLAHDAAKNMQTGFSDLFFNSMKGDFDSLSDIAEKTFNRILDSFLRMVADMAAQQLMSTIFGSTPATPPTGQTVGNTVASTATSAAVNTAATSAWSYVSDWWATSTWADGGYIGANPRGGMINAGSGTRDDVFLGYSDGGSTANYGMGGEFIVNKKATQKYLPLLNDINSVGYASGGVYGGDKRVFARFEQLATAMQGAGYSTAEINQSLQKLSDSLDSLMESSGNAADASRSNAEASARQTSATTAQTSATNTAAVSTIDVTNSIVGFAGSVVGTGTRAQATSAAVGMLGGTFGGLTGVIGLGISAALGYAAEITGLTAAFNDAIAAAKVGINDLQAAIGAVSAAQTAFDNFAATHTENPSYGYFQGWEVAAISGAGFDSGYNDAGFGGYAGDLSGNSTDSSGDVGSSNGTTGSADSDGHGFNGENDNDSGWALGGFIKGGSGYKDDVFLGYSDGGRIRNFGMGGEFVTRKDRAVEWASELEYINTHRKFDFTPLSQGFSPSQPVGIQQQAPDRIVVNIHGKGIEAIIDKVIVTRERQGVSGSAYA